MTRLLFDIEADGIQLHLVNNIWCMVIMDVDTGVVSTYRLDALYCACKMLMNADCIMGHNVIGYDLPVIWKLLGPWETTPKIVDTLVISRALLPERPGGHSLAAWGERLDYPKDTFDDFSCYSPELLKRCVRDVEVNHQLLLQFEEELGESLTGYKVYD